MSGVIRPEVAYAWDYVTGEARVLGIGKGRDYSAATETEIVGTVDQEIIWADTTLARDFKSGYGYLAPAARNPQLRFFSLCHSSVYPGRSNVVELVKILDNGDLACEPAEISPEENIVTAESLKLMVGEIKAAQVDIDMNIQPDVFEGAWCKFCPAFEACPAKVGLLRKYLGGGVAIDFSALTQAYRLIRNLEAFAKKGLERVKEMVEDAGEALDLGNGMVFGRSPKDGKMREFRR